MNNELSLLPDLEQAEALPELSTVTEDERYNLIELLQRTTFNERQIEFLEREINNCESQSEFQTLVKNIIPNMIEDKDRIAMGFPYGARDIIKTLKQLR